MPSFDVPCERFFFELCAEAVATVSHAMATIAAANVKRVVRVMLSAFRTNPSRIQAFCPATAHRLREARASNAAHLVPRRENDSKPRLAAQHSLECLVDALDREDFVHGPHAGEHAE